MELRVGEVARATGLTVRTLHHYDEIGLVKPSVRSSGGYRLYTPEDISRLNVVQALRQLGFSLAQVQELLAASAGKAPDHVLKERLEALDRQMAATSELRERVELLRHSWRSCREVTPGAWVQSLSMMEVFGRYFSANELRSLLGTWNTFEPKWRALIQDMEAFVAAGGRPDSPEGHAYARRVLALLLHWMGGDLRMVERWRDMYRRERYVHGWGGNPSTGLVEFIGQAIRAMQAAEAEPAASTAPAQDS